METFILFHCRCADGLTVSVFNRNVHISVLLCLGADTDKTSPQATSIFEASQIYVTNTTARNIQILPAFIKSSCAYICYNYQHCTKCDSSCGCCCTVLLCVTCTCNEVSECINIMYWLCGYTVTIVTYRSSWYQHACWPTIMTSGRNFIGCLLISDIQRVT